MAVIEPSTRKIAIIGKAPSSRELAPYDDPEWEIWTLSNLVPEEQVPRWDVHFELHAWAYLQAAHPEGKYLEWLGQDHGKKPILVAKEIPEIPSGVEFPKQQIVERYGTYFSNTVSWMIAYAISLEPAEIGVWGVDMAQDTEYQRQRPSCEFFLGWVRGARIKLQVPDESDMLKTPRLYGFDEDDGQMTAKWQARTAEVRERLGRTAEKRDQLSLKAAYLEGCLQSQEYYAQVFGL